jgi:hypothetical protein
VNRNNSNRSNGLSVRCVRESKGTNAKETDFFILISYICQEAFFNLPNNPFFGACVHRPESAMVTAMLSAPLESGNPPS